jgi:O-antigen/teichoic acid export membrane protein
MGSAGNRYEMQKLHVIRKLLGIDRAVFYSILLRVFSTAGNIVTIPLILTRLSPMEQGYFYTFGSILALQIFLEMGFGTVAIQLMAHEAAHLKIDLKAGISGSLSHLDQFSANFHFIKRWYGVVSIFIAIFLFPVGFWFFSSSTQGETVHWVLPWAILVVSTAGDVFVRSMDSTIEGMGYIAESIRVNLWSSVIRVILSVLGLLLGLKLYAVPIASAIALVLNRWMVWQLLHVVNNSTMQFGRNIKINWVKDILPFQWRIALSWVSGWFIFSAMMPVVFRRFGSAEAGRFGLAMSISNFINTFAMNWVTPKFAVWGQMVSKREWKSMDDLFWKVAPWATVVALIGSIMAVLAIPHLGLWFPRFAGRVPDARLLSTLCLVPIMNQIVFSEAFYLRAHKKEPFITNSVVIGLTMVLGLTCFTHHSVHSIASMYAAVTFVGLIWATLLFIRCRAKWHLD